MKHREISERLTSEIVSGGFKSGSRLPSEEQLAARFSVSRPTVARALRDLQMAGLIERRAGSGTYVKDQESSVQQLRRLGLLIPALGQTEIFELICGEIMSLARAAGYHAVHGRPRQPMLGNEMDRKKALRVCEEFIQQEVAGVFFAPFEHTEDDHRANQRIVERLRESGTPIVLLDRDITPFPDQSDFDVVGLDNITAGFVVAEHLIKLGCAQITFVSRPQSASTVNARIAGVREAINRHGLEMNRDWLHVGNPTDKRFVRKLLSGKRWDACICANDATAAQLIATAEAVGLSVPRDVRVVGFDDVKQATVTDVPLTTIRQPCREIGMVAFQTLLARMKDPTIPARGVRLRPQLVVRESCGVYL